MPNIWMVEQTPRGTYDVVLNRRAWQYDLPDKELARDLIRRDRRATDEDEVVFVATDGAQDVEPLY